MSELYKVMVMQTGQGLLPLVHIKGFPLLKDKVQQKSYFSYFKHFFFQFIFPKKVSAQKRTATDDERWKAALLNNV